MFWTTLSQSFEAQTKEAARCKPRCSTLILGKRHADPSSLSHSLRLHSDDTEYRLPSPLEAVPRVVLQDCRAHGYRLHAVSTEVGYLLDVLGVSCSRALLIRPSFSSPRSSFLTLVCLPRRSFDSPETVLILRSIQPFETLYLTRSTNRLNEAVTSSFSISSSLSASFSSRPPTVPTANEGLSASRAIVNELDAARFDPLLVKAIAKGASRAVELYVQKAEALVRSLAPLSRQLLVERAR